MGILASLVVINNNADTEMYMQTYTLLKAVSSEARGTRGLDKCFVFYFINVGMSEIETLSPLCGMVWFTLEDLGARKTLLVIL